MNSLEELPVDWWKFQGVGLLFIVLLLAFGSYAFRLRKRRVDATSCRVVIVGGLCGVVAFVAGATLFFHFVDMHRDLFSRLIQADWIDWLIGTLFQCTPVIGALVGAIVGVVVTDTKRKNL